MRGLRRVRVDQRDLQGNVLAGYGNDFDETLYVFLRAGDPVAGRGLVGNLAGRVTDAVPWEAKPADTLNVAVTYRGLRALGVPEAVLLTFPEEFRQGMAARAELLGDTGPDAPPSWEAGLRDDDLDLLVTISAQDRPTLDQARERLLAEIASWEPGVELAGELRASLLRDSQGAVFAREHFGFADGLAQPSIAAVGVERRRQAGPTARRGQGTPMPRGRWRDVAVGEFVLGYRDEDGVLPDAPAEPLGHSGTFTVVRKLHQDVAAFTRHLREAAGGDAELEERVAARMVGRHRDGTPLMPAAGINNFRYESDPRGEICPLGAHIRRANPRDAFGWHGRLTRRHRIIRRGTPYGRSPADPAVDDGEPRGLVFVCHQASISRQFELVQRWMTDGDAFNLGAERDPLLGGRPPFVSLRGGGYFFTPGLGALRALAAGL